MRINVPDGHELIKVEDHRAFTRTADGTVFWQWLPSAKFATGNILRRTTQVMTKPIDWPIHRNEASKAFPIFKGPQWTVSSDPLLIGIFDNSKGEAA